MLAAPHHAGSRFRRLLARLAAALTLLAGVLVVGTGPAAAVTGDTRLHDPSVIRVGDCFYGFSTGFEDGPNGGAVTIHKTCDATLYGGWQYIDTVWKTPPSWIKDRLGVVPPNFWAPDINYFNGKYHLYYAASIWGKPGAAMGLLTATNIEGPWTDQGHVTSVNYPIDPNVTFDGETAYISWGSFAGVYMHVLDPSTGKLSTTDHRLPKLSTGIENPTIVFDDGYYYLFGSRGGCCSGVNSTYYTVVGRSRNIMGPYLDRTGRDLAQGGGTLVLRGKGTQIAAGGGDLFTDGSATRMVYHFYDGTNKGRERVNVRRVTFADGWPVLGPPVGESPAQNTRLLNTKTKRALTGPAGTAVVDAAWTGAADQQWQFEDVGDGYVRIVNRGTDRCLDVVNGSVAAGAAVIQWACGYGHNQQWRAVAVDKGWQYVARHSGLCLHAEPAPTPKVVQSTCVENDKNMRWNREVTDAPRPAPPVGYEAEAAGNTRAGNLVDSECSHCSGGTQVRSKDRGKPSSLTFNGVTAGATGSALLTIAYTNGQVADRQASVRINGGEPIEVSFPETRATRPQTVSVIVSLTRGTNTVTFANPTNRGPDLDGITIEPLPGT